MMEKLIKGDCRCGNKNVVLYKATLNGKNRLLCKPCLKSQITVQVYVEQRNPFSESVSRYLHYSEKARRRVI